MLDTFDTNMESAAIVGKIPLPNDYKESMVVKIIEFIENGKLSVHGNEDKAMQAV